jgi:hypothetical protein
MRPLSNFNFSILDTYPKCLAEIENQINELIIRIEECEASFTEEDRTQLIANIEWLKHFYEAAERNLLNGDR